MKKFAGVLALILLLELLVACGVGSYSLPNGDEYDVEQLSVFDDLDDTYYLRKAPQNIVFHILSPTSEKSKVFSLVDSKGVSVDAGLAPSTSHGYNITPPSNGYTPGERYTLTLLGNACFIDENLQDAQVLTFCIEQDAVEEYEYTSVVKEQSVEIESLSDSVISMGNIDAEPGEILFGKNNAEEYVAYKIEEVLPNGTALVSLPALDEIYADLNVYGDYVFDVSKLVMNPALEAEIVDNIKSSTFFSSLLTTAYAAEPTQDPNIEVSISPDKETNSLSMEIEIKLKPGENGLFNIEQLKNHYVTITLMPTFWFATHVNIQDLSNMDISTTVRSSLSWNIEISHKLYSNDDPDSWLNGLFSNNKSTGIDTNSYNNYVQSIVKKLMGKDADRKESEIPLFKWDLPVPSVPGLSFSIEVKAFFDVELLVEASLGQEIYTIYTVGIRITDDDCSTYSSRYKDTGDLMLSFAGKLTTKIGFKIEFVASFVNEKIAHIKLVPEIGLKAEALATVDINLNDIAAQSSHFY